MSLYSIAGRVGAFFLQNPHEELSAEDIAQKFGVDVGHVRQSLMALCRSGDLRKVRGGGGPGGCAVYAAGPRMLRVLGLAAEACVPVERR